MNTRFAWLCLCVIFCLGAHPQLLQIISIDTDNSVSLQVVMNHYFHLSEILKPAIKFYRVNSGKVYWMTGTLMVVASTDTHMPAANAAS